MICDIQNAIHTIGHSTRTIESFMELLRAHGIGLVIDVRRWPASTRFPHFGREALSAFLAGGRIDYLWRKDLGGYRKPSSDSPNGAWKNAAFRAYADFMLTAEFASIIPEMESLTRERRTAIMCAEAVPWRCHRQLLADAFVARGWAVRHILDTGCHAHRLTGFARVEGEKIFYPS